MCEYCEEYRKPLDKQDNFSVWMLGSDYTTAGPVMGTEVIGPKAVGQALFTHYLLLVEVAAMLLLAALVAAFHLGKREPSAEKEKE